MELVSSGKSKIKASFFEGKQLSAKGAIVFNGERRAKCFLWPLYVLLNTEKVPLEDGSIINGKDFQNDYLNGFNRGQNHFIENFSIDQRALYQEGGANYIKDLHQWFFHNDPMGNMFFGFGWNFFLYQYPKYADAKLIDFWGFYSGIIYEVNALRERHKALFKNFDDYCGEIHKEKNNDREYKELKDVFINEADYNKAIEALKVVNNPVIDNENNFILGERKKSAFTAWVDILKSKGKIRSVSDSIMADLINKEIKGVNLYIDGSSLRKRSKKNESPYVTYKTRFNSLIPKQGQ